MMAAAIEIPVEGVFEESQGVSAPNWEVEKTPSNKFDDIMEQAQRMHELRVVPDVIDNVGRGLPSDLNVGDDVIDLSSLVFASTGDVYAPGFGRARLALSAKKVIRQVTGLDSDKFFRHLPLEEIQGIWETYFSNLPANVTNQRRVIARRPLTGEDIGSNDCLIRGFVSSRYVDIPDISILEMVKEVVGPKIDNLVVDTRWHNENTVITLLDQEAEKIAQSTVKDMADEALCGLQFWTSDVGASSFKAFAYIWRLFCSNGMGSTTKGDWLFRKNHRSWTREELIGMIGNAWNNVPTQIDLFKRRATLLREITFPDGDVEGRVRDWLRHLSERRKQLVLEAFQYEPENTAYGVLQAITRAAGAVRNRLDHRQGLEKVADAFVRSMTQKMGD